MSVEWAVFVWFVASCGVVLVCGVVQEWRGKMPRDDGRIIR